MKKRYLISVTLTFILLLTNCDGSKSTLAQEQQNKGQKSIDKVKADSTEENIIKLLANSVNPINDKDLIKLFNITLSDLGSDFVNENDPDKKPEFKIIGKQYYSIDSENYLLAVLGITNPNDLHISSGSINIGLFQFKSIQWKRTDLLKNVGVFSGYGAIGEIENYNVFGTKNVSVSLFGSYMSQGVFEENRVIIGVVNNSLKEIYVAQKSFNDEGNLGTEAKETQVSFMKTKDKYYELKEVKLSKNRVIETSFLRFNEKELKYE